MISISRTPERALRARLDLRLDGAGRLVPADFFALVGVRAIADFFRAADFFGATFFFALRDDLELFAREVLRFGMSRV